MLGKFFVTVSFQIVSVSAFWEILQITNSPLWLGLAGLAEAGPVILCSLFSGYFIDLYRKKKILILCNTAFLAVSLLMIAVRLDFPVYNLASIYVAMALMGIIRSFYAPTNVALMVASVPRERLPESSAWNGSLWHVAFFGGSFLGGMLNGFFDAWIAYAVSAGCMCAALLLNSMVESHLGMVLGTVKTVKTMKTAQKIRHASESESESKSDLPDPPNLPDPTTAADPPSLPAPTAPVALSAFRKYLDGLAESIRFLRKERVLLACFSVDTMVVFFAGAIALLPIFADSILNVGAQGLGFLRAAPGMGALCISLVLSRYPKFLNHHTGRKLVSSMSLFAFAMLAFAISTDFLLSLFCLFASGLFDGISVVIRSSLLQIVSPDFMRGRLAAINSIFVSSSNELGAVESGVTAELFGTVPSVIMGAVFIQLLLILVVIRVPELLKLNYKTLLASKESSKR